MRIAIVGSRDYKHLQRVRDFIADQPADTIIISGGARGVDQTAAEAARKRKLQVVEHRPDYLKEGAAATWIRNGKIVVDAEQVVAFWDGVSRGTAHTMELAKAVGKLLAVFDAEGVRIEG